MDLVWVDDVHVIQDLPHLDLPEFIFGIDHSFQAEFDTGGIEVFPVVKLHPLAEVEFPGCFIDDFVGSRQKRLDLKLFIPLEQGIENFEADVERRRFVMVVRIQGGGVNPLGNNKSIFGCTPGKARHQKDHKNYKSMRGNFFHKFTSPFPMMVYFLCTFRDR